MSASTTSSRRDEALRQPLDTFVRRHLGPDAAQVERMLAAIGVESLEALVAETVPAAIRSEDPLQVGPERGERALLAELHAQARRNQIQRSLLGLGYYDCITPPVIQRNILENPGWYTQYTPYQAELAQGRLEMLFNFQTMVSDLTGLPLANASLLDEGTAAAEAVTMCHNAARGKKPKFYVADGVHPQTLAVMETRAVPQGIELVQGSAEGVDFSGGEYSGILVQYPDTEGSVRDLSGLVEAAHAAKAKVVVATDLLALCLLKAPGAQGADIAFGSAQRFGVPMGAGGPHAAFMACTDDFKRIVPGRIVGLSHDAREQPAYRLALQTREQHIRRDRATSNICTAQVLLAVMAGAYAVYHGPEGLRAIAERVHRLTGLLAAGLRRKGLEVAHAAYFDTLKVTLAASELEAVLGRAAERGINLRRYADGVGVSLDEVSSADEVEALLGVFAGEADLVCEDLAGEVSEAIPAGLQRGTDYLTHAVFHSYHSEHEMLRYLHRLQSRDLSLTTSMIPLGSCTMKLNATAEMLPVTWPEFGRVHPFAPVAQRAGYEAMIAQLGEWLADITGFHAISFQPNAGSQGEYAGLMVIRAYHQQRGQGHRDVCLIPTSAHGTNPASAVMAGMKVVAVQCDERGNIDLADLEAKAEQHKDQLSALMVTYPSTHGVFETTIRDVCRVIHERGGQVYLDGANMNAMVGLCRPGLFGADVAHLNLHKTFCIPHGGGGPGMGPIGVAEHLAPFLPGHPFGDGVSETACGAISAAPYGSPSILPISWMYVGLMGSAGLTRASQVAILSANYMAKRLEGHYDILYRGANGRVAHEFIVDMRGFKATAGVTVDDVAKRLMDFGFHAPTMSWPVAGTMMIEPTESESQAELDRYCEAMIVIREEIRKVESGEWDREDNPLKHAPHTADVVLSDAWDRSYPREIAAYPAPWVREHKFWPYVGRIDNAHGDRNLVCTCPPVSAFT